jgi:hypothetical protein
MSWTDCLSPYANAQAVAAQLVCPNGTWALDAADQTQILSFDNYSKYSRFLGVVFPSIFLGIVGLRIFSHFRLWQNFFVPLRENETVRTKLFVTSPKSWEFYSALLHLVGGLTYIGVVLGFLNKNLDADVLTKNEPNLVYNMELIKGAWMATLGVFMINYSGGCISFDTLNTWRGLILILISGISYSTISAHNIILDENSKKVVDRLSVGCILIFVSGLLYLLQHTMEEVALEGRRGAHEVISHLRGWYGDRGLVHKKVSRFIGQDQNKGHFAVYRSAARELTYTRHKYLFFIEIILATGLGLLLDPHAKDRLYVHYVQKDVWNESYYWVFFLFVIFTLVVFAGAMLSMLQSCGMCDYADYDKLRETHYQLAQSCDNTTYMYSSDPVVAQHHIVTQFMKPVAETPCDGGSSNIEFVSM